MKLDYAAMGKRIKRLRREQRLSQERLAELIDLANALNTTPDVLLLDQMKSQDKTRCMVIEEIDRELSDCTMAQMTLIEESVRNTKKILKSYEKKMNRKEY